MSKLFGWFSKNKKAEKQKAQAEEEARLKAEAEAKAMSPDYFLVLPWHFKENILAREQEFLSKGGKFIFPLPEIEIV